MNNICFLTSNIQKAKDISSFGISVKEFSIDVPEVLSSDVETVVLYKAKDTNLDNILVEDTSLDVDGAHFLGTEIKHVYDEIKEDFSFNDRSAVWRVSMCMKQGDNFYISTGELHGKLKYPELEYGYHFNKLLSVDIYKNNQHRFFEQLSSEEKQKFGPRFIALRKLKNALKTQNYSEIKIVNKNCIKKWMGSYQVENTKENLQKKPTL